MMDRSSEREREREHAYVYTCVYILTLRSFHAFMYLRAHQTQLAATVEAREADMDALRLQSEQTRQSDLAEWEASRQQERLRWESERAASASSIEALMRDLEV
jgi:hypothetical protein